MYLQQRVSHIDGPSFIMSREILHVKNNRNPNHPSPPPPPPPPPSMMVCMSVKYVCVHTVYLQQRVPHIVGPCFIASGEILHVKNNRNPKHPSLYFCNCSNFLKRKPRKEGKKKKKNTKFDNSLLYLRIPNSDWNPSCCCNEIRRRM